jgi:hypothetical protein
MELWRSYRAIGRELRFRSARWGETAGIPGMAACGSTPKNLADLYSWVVPVFAAIGRFQRSAFADADAVPMIALWLSPVSRVSASPWSSTRWQPRSVIGTAAGPPAVAHPSRGADRSIRLRG